MSCRNVLKPSKNGFLLKCKNITILSEVVSTYITVLGFLKKGQKEVLVFGQKSKDMCKGNSIFFVLKISLQYYIFLESALKML